MSSRCPIAIAPPDRVAPNDGALDRSSTGAEVADRITSLACRLLRAPFAYARYVLDSGETVESWQGVPGPEVARYRAFCDHPILAFGAVANQDLAGDRRFRDHPLVKDGPRLRYFAACPIAGQSARVAGRLSVLDPSPHPAGGDDLDALRELARLVEAMLGGSSTESLLPSSGRDSPRSSATREHLEPIDAGIGLLFSAVREAVIVGDIETDQIVLWNPAAALMFGYSPDEILGSPIDILIPPALKDGHRDGMRQFRVTGHGEIIDGRHAVEMTALRKDGREIDVEMSLTAIENQVAGRRLAIAVLRDVTERKTLDRMKSEFVSIVSHELRTPLTAMRGSLGLLAGGAFGEIAPSGRRMLDIAVRNTDRLARLINDILDLERIQSGKALTAMTECDAAELMRTAAELVESRAAEAQIAIRVSPAPARLHADADRVVQLLTNLLSNAIKFSPPRSEVWLTVEVRSTELVFRVADRGRGIPVDKQDIIFERFQQLDASDSREKGGSGLGLAICRGIAEQHGGRIWVDSTVGVGSTFAVALPIEPRPTPDEGS